MFYKTDMAKSILVQKATKKPFAVSKIGSLHCACLCLHICNVWEVVCFLLEQENLLVLITNKYFKYDQKVKITVQYYPAFKEFNL